MFGRLTPLVKNLLIINVGIALIQAFMKLDLGQYLGLHFILAPEFKPYQFVTYMFLHSTSSMMHIFGNMFALFIFGPLLEQFLGQKKFLILYMVTGVGAGLFYTAVNYIEVADVKRDVEAYVANPSSDEFNRLLIEHGSGLNPQIYDFVDMYSRNEDDPQLKEQSVRLANQLYSIYGQYNMVGASGAIFGVLAAFALFFPNTELFLLFIPFPIKAKYLVSVYILYEVYAELQRAPGDNVAHLAHIGGALIAYILVRIWKSQRQDFY
ncbi:rhomboid family protein [Roseivirga pacifica]|uniref:Rhomboid family protein n=1 Tax=Roseivirga pacifica TaxID=1267423 RepID=A0A1I0NCA7_9BACT|nr:rhomboid family intramembrane serine protease [Roseivirga pacifica]MCO6359590.1 rhomboid family intramembrane serine protease [Roseivirga pacifica]MCO6366960.1 rhomboid family intramembrane serine protease [Roseivirga pacifica]MCO6370508.1 rhomboid family intramembrane serine protease [Roseivirga pacifica]MCO6374617.1 rhomboid family intramembrane serine protease [Roseivirga pacifica]MCO6379875.1 rhomboid family intramembrane serine protease [Roseivirga pacifica]